MKRWCIDHDMTLAELAAQIGVHENTIYGISAGDRDPSLGVLQKMPPALALPILNHLFSDLTSKDAAE